MQHTSHAHHDMHGLAGLTGTTFDRAYLSMMIAHHQGAVDMTRAVRDHLQDPQVREWTSAIREVQAREIHDMTAWLTDLGGMDSTMSQKMAADMNAVTQALTGASDPDRALIEGMVPHHVGAVEMALLALQNSSDGRVLAQARDIVRTQATELYDYRTWLVQRLTRA